MQSLDYISLFKIRTITCFVSLSKIDFETKTVEVKLEDAIRVGRRVEKALVETGYTVQTVRIATNPFPDWLEKETLQSQLDCIDSVLQKHELEFCALGPALQPSDLAICRAIIQASPKFSCSALLQARDVNMADAVADCILDISKMNHPAHLADGLGNFRFCSTTSKAFIPFFPAARAETRQDERVGFAIGLENGSLAFQLLKQCQSIDNISMFQQEFAQAVLPVQTVCSNVAELEYVNYLGMDTSLNPSLDASGSVAKALETLDQVAIFGGPGSLAAAAAITESIQTLPDVKRIGYCGLMLPLCEDVRLAELSSQNSMSIANLLSVSHVCGVGIDTVPVPGDCSKQELAALLLDVAAVANRWKKCLSCRVFPVPSKTAGDMTEFDFVHMVNAKILSIS